jgi:hypothetical protein
MLIYKVTNLVNGKIYIGQTRHAIEQRWERHVNRARYNLKKKEAFCSAIRQYGERNLVIEDIDKADSLTGKNG